MLFKLFLFRENSNLNGAQSMKITARLSRRHLMGVYCFNVLAKHLYDRPFLDFPRKHANIKRQLNT